MDKKNMVKKSSRRSALPLSRECLKRLSPYLPGFSLEEAQRLGKSRLSPVKLASNENPLGTSPLAKAAVEKTLAQIYLYPESGAPLLRQKIARKCGLTPHNVFLGNGSDEVVYLLAEAYFERSAEVLVAEPTFSTYRHVSILAGADVKTVPLKDQTVDLEAMLKAVTKKTKMIFLCNPNNPTGTFFTDKQLRLFLNKLPRGILVVLDEAYSEYADSPYFPDGLKYVREGFPVIILRTFSKIYGLAGLRVGYGIAPAPVIAAMESVRLPFNVNRLGQAAALAALGDDKHLRRSRQNNLVGKRFLYRQLKKMGLAYTPTQANFIMIHLGKPAQPIFGKMLEEGVIIRPLDSFGLSDFIRITIGTPSQNQRLIKALKKVI